MHLKVGVADGARTHDNRNHNPGLYQLSYSQHIETHCYTTLADHYQRAEIYTMCFYMVGVQGNDPCFTD